MEYNSRHELSTLDIRDILDADSRPTFIIDLDPDNELVQGVRRISPVFCNSALRQHEKLFDAVHGNCDLESDASNGSRDYYEAFRDWTTGVTTQDDSKDVFPLSFFYEALLWTGSTISKRWRLISGNRAWKRDLSPGALLEISASTTAQTLTTDAIMEDVERSDNARHEAGIHFTAGTSTNPSAPGPIQDTIPTGTTFAVAPNPEASSVAERSKGSSKETAGTTGSIVLSKPDKAVADWTVPNPEGILSPHIQVARNIDWASTPLGSMESWSPEFRQIVNLCMNSPNPASVLWGDELTMIYNAGYATEIAGNKHPSMMGTGLSGPWAEIWDGMETIFTECVRTGAPFRCRGEMYLLHRNGFLEETYVSWSLTPLYGGTDRITGFYNAAFETTAQVLSQRWMQMVNKLGDATSNATTVKRFWQALLESLEDSAVDVPFAILYSVGEGEDGDYSSVSSGSTLSSKVCHLEGTIGVPDGHVAAPSNLDLKRSSDGFVSSFREAMRTREPTHLQSRDATLPDVMREGIQWRGYGEAGREAIIFPIRPTNGDAVLAFLVVGVNPCRRYDEGYKAFANLLNRQLATSLASVILFEEETRRSRDAAEAAALEKEELTQKLDLQASRLRRMTEVSPVGMLLISPEGVLREANDRFFEMTGLEPRETQSEMSWTECIVESSMKEMEEGWDRLTKEGLPWSGELQLKGNATDTPDVVGEPIDYWVRFIAKAEFTSDMAPRSIIGSITEISYSIWAQGLQNRQLKEAEETRRQQNEFMDITSHEIRNPLSAILQCADDISSTLTSYFAHGATPPQTIIESCIDAAQTIALCVQHQKAIVDDVLTVSKLDSNLLLITPVVCQPEAIMKRVLKMFDAEVQAKNIELTLEMLPSFKELSATWVTMDPSRILQILINLITNAIKFTAASEQRIINLAVGVSYDPPDETSVPGFQYVPCEADLRRVTDSEDWGGGEALYIWFRVLDTGCGLTSDEKQRLFQRFKQASPRTHAQYGGSGLGLFISKRLAELQGGMIGVASTAGEGSQFGFYVQARRSMPPETPEALASPPILIEPPPTIPAPITDNDGRIVKKAAGLPPVRRGSVPSIPGNGNGNRDLHVLVVEDNLINQRVLVKQLRKEGCMVSAANDGVEALEFLGKTEFCLEGGLQLSIILMDLEMPTMDGLTCVREIRRMQREGSVIKHVPVIAATANVREGQVKAAIDSGMDGIVSKPFRILDLLQKIRSVLERLEESRNSSPMN